MLKSVINFWQHLDIMVKRVSRLDNAGSVVTAIDAGKILGQIPSIDEGVREDYLRGDLHFVSMPINNMDGGIIIEAIRRAMNPESACYCEHAFRGHAANSVIGVGDSIIGAIQKGDPNSIKIEISERKIKNACGEIVPVERVVLMAEPYLKDIDTYLWEEAGLYLKGRFKGNTKSFEKQIYQYAQNPTLGLPFAILAAIKAGLSIDGIINIFKTREENGKGKTPSMSSQIRGQTRLLSSIMNIINKEGHSYSNELSNLLSELCISSGSNDQLITQKYPLRQYVHTPMVVFMTLGEYFQRNAPPDIYDPARSNKAQSNFDTVTTQVRTIYNGVDFNNPECRYEVDWMKPDEIVNFFYSLQKES
jgi:hypothetical protein